MPDYKILIKTLLTHKRILVLPSPHLIDVAKDIIPNIKKEINRLAPFTIKHDAYVSLSTEAQA